VGEVMSDGAANSGGHSGQKAVASFPISEQLLSFIEQAPVAIALFDRDMRYLATSESWNAGYGLGSACLAGLSPYDAFPQLPRRWREVHKRVLVGEEVACGEEPLTRADGGTDWVRWCMKPWRHPSGEIAGALMFTEVITGQIEARTKIAQSEALFRETFENAAVGIAHAAPNGAWLLVNPQMCTITGYSAEELLTKTVRDITHAGDFEEYLPQVKSMYRGEIDSFGTEKRYIRKDGSIVWARLRISCARKAGGEIDHFIAVIVDISAQKMAEIALRESEERLGAALRAGRLGVHDYDPQTGRVKWDRETYRLWGVPEGEAVTMETFEAGVHSEDLCVVRAALSRALDPSGTRRYECEYRVVSRADGAVRWISADGDVTFEGGSPVRLVGTVQDITERKKREAQVELLLREVNHRAKNLLGVVQAIASQTAVEGCEEFIARFSDRVRALAANQDLLVKSQWQGVKLGELVSAQLAHFEGLIGSRIEIAGPPLRIAAEAAQPIAMALHELATNAGKYGALSNSKGKIRIAWDFDRDGSFHLSWTESGGPAGSRPGRRGFGTMVIADTPEIQLDAKVALEFPSSGAEWRLSCPAKNILETGNTGIDCWEPA